MKKIYGFTLGCLGMAAALSGCTPQLTTNVPNVIRVENVDAGQQGRIFINSNETVEVTPDMAEIVYGIRTEDTDASACQKKNTETLNKVLAFLKDQGFEEKSIKTTGFSLDPRYDWSGNTRELIGYEMRTQVTVTDVPVGDVGGLLSKTVESGANEILNVTYFSSTYDEAYREALKKAVDLARGKAEAIAEADGRQVGKVLRVEEYNDGQYGRYVSCGIEQRSMKMMDAEAAPAAGAADMGVMPGQMKVTANICVDFEMLP